MTQKASAAAGDLDLAQFWQGLLNARVWMLTGAVVVGLLAAAMAVLSLPVYTAEAVLMVAGEEESGGLQGLSSLASRVGLNMGGLIDGGADRKVEAVATLQSRALTEEFIRQHDLLPVLFASKWNAATKTWKTTDPEKRPTLWNATELFRKRVRAVSEDRRTGLVTLVIRWKDKEAVAQWANELVELANATLRQKAIDRSARNLDYLRSELKRGNTVEVQQSIYNLVEAEINRAMLVRGNEQYAFRVIDPAVVPQESQLARQLKLIVSGVLLGALGGAVLSFLSGAFRNRAR